MISHRNQEENKLEWSHMSENATSIENLGHESDVTVEFIYIHKHLYGTPRN